MSSSSSSTSSSSSSWMKLAGGAYDTSRNILLSRVIPILLLLIIGGGGGGGITDNFANSLTIDGRRRTTNPNIDCGRAATILQRQPRTNDNEQDEKKNNSQIKILKIADTEEKQQVDDDNNVDTSMKNNIIMGRIFNGKPSKRGSWPWQVSLQLLHPKLGFIGHWCGGVLIDSTWILTAAHCIHNDLFNLPIGALWTVVLGEWQLESRNVGSVRIPVDRVIIHERFNNYVNDIALMKLSRAAPLSNMIRTICLPRDDDGDGDDDDDEENDERESECVASGWGRSGPSPSLSNALLEAKVPILNIKVCQGAYGNTVPIGPGHLCAGHIDGSSGSCVGDSGGPLQCRGRDGLWHLVGLTSFGSGCARPGYPDVYTRLVYHLDWIKKTIGEAEPSPHVYTNASQPNFK